MFNIAINGMIAFQQSLSLFAGLFCLFIGLLILGYVLYWQLRATRIRGTIKGVKKSGSFYKLVFSYMMPDGTTHECVSSMGSSALPKVQTNQEISLLVFPHDPDKAQRAGVNLWGLLLGAIFLVPGVLFFQQGVTMAPFKPLTAFVMLGMIAFLVLKLSPLANKRPQNSPALGSLSADQTDAAQPATTDDEDFPPALRKNKFLFRLARFLLSASKNNKDNMAIRQALKARMAAKPGDDKIMSLEEARSTPENTASAIKARQGAKVAAPICLIAGAVAIGLACYLGQKTQALETRGLHAEGRVVRMQSSTSNNSTTYRPVVEYYPQGSGQSVEFKSRVGSSSPSHHTGDTVKVLYLEDDPEGSAIIDDGWMNWLGTMIAGFVGLVFLLIGWSQLRLLNERTL